MSGVMSLALYQETSCGVCGRVDQRPLSTAQREPELRAPFGWKRFPGLGWTCAACVVSVQAYLEVRLPCT
jgi:hypothetical protein